MDDLLIQKLQNPNLYPHPVKNFKVLETHLSWVILTGSYAYKIKKPVNFGFVNFSTLEKRHFYCEKEIELNQAFAKELYIGVIPITNTETQPTLNGEGPIIEYAVKMHQFEQSQLLPEVFERQELKAQLYSFASELAIFHLKTDKSNSQSTYGTPEEIWKEMSDNFRDCLSKTTDLSKITNKNISTQLNTLEKWCQQEFIHYLPFLKKRKNSGFIRNCHGDLHLGNMILQNQKITLFDRIEFNEEFRWIDIMNEVAFLVMDLEVNHHPAEAFYFLNHYLEITGDYEGLKLLRFYKIYRTMVRDKVALLTGYSVEDPQFITYLNLANNYILPAKPMLIIMCGVSGSGKSSISLSLAAIIKAIRIQSDVERKRLFPELVGTSTLYSKKNTEKTYNTLKTLAKTILTSGLNVIVDATFLKFEFREIFKKLALELSISFKILHLNSSYPIIKERISNRTQNDISEATLDILDSQLKNQDHLTE